MSVFPSTYFIDETYDLIETDTPHLALYTSNPQADNSGTEVSGGSYAREPITFTRVGTQMQNDTEIRFTLPTGTVTHFGILNALTSGDLKVYGALTTSAGVVSGDELVFPIASISIDYSGS